MTTKTNPRRLAKLALTRPSKVSRAQLHALILKQETRTA